MKKLSVLIITILFSSCIKEAPEANFNVSVDSAYTFEDIFFTNTSLNSYSFKWNFGNDSTSDIDSPVYFYESEGLFNVSLTAFSKHERRSDEMAKTITITQPTDLLINIFRSNDSLPLNDCSIFLYNNLDDWKNLKNHVYVKTSNEFGLALFRNLEPKSYYIDFIKVEPNGYWSNLNPNKATKTEELAKNKLNKLTVHLELKTN